MKAILEYNLPDEQQEYDLANKGSDLSIIIWDFDQWLRNEVKYNNELTDKESDTYYKIRDKLREIMEEHDLTFNNNIFQ